MAVTTTLSLLETACIRMCHLISVRYGVWGDWSRPYVTLQPEYEAAQLRVFGAMFLNGHIYRYAAAAAAHRAVTTTAVLPPASAAAAPALIHARCESQLIAADAAQYERHG